MFEPFVPQIPYSNSINQGDVLMSGAAERHGGEGSRRRAAAGGREEKETGEKSPIARNLSQPIAVVAVGGNILKQNPLFSSVANES